MDSSGKIIIKGWGLCNQQEVTVDRSIESIIILNTTSVPNYIAKVGDDTLTQSLLADGDRVDSV